MQLLASGLLIDTLAEILTGFETAELAGIAPTLDLVAPDPIAVLNGVVAERLSSLEELAAVLYDGMQPDNATGDQLEGIALITGTTRQPADKTTVACSITVDAAFGPQAPGAMLASVVGVPNLLYTNVDEFSAAGAGTTAGVIFACVETGPNPVNASTLTVIASPLNHWTAITNPAAGVTGLAIQTDAGLRAAREAELAAGGSTNAAAIRADILQLIQPSQSPLTIAGIKTGTDPTNNPFTITAATISVTVLWNDKDVADANGLPGHSIEVIAYAPGASTEDTDALCALILVDKAAGVQTYSGDGTFKTITDDQGTAEAVYYTRPSALNTLIDVTVKQRTGHVVTENEVKDAIMAYIAGTDRNGVALDGYSANWTPGATAYASAIVGAIFAYDIPGVANVTGVVLDAANVGPDIVPTVRQVVGVADPLVDITVTVT